MAVSWRKLLIITLMIGLVMALLPTNRNTQPTFAQDQETFGSDWFREGVMYEVFVRSFRDTNGDGIGDLQGVIEGLDYIQSLGANIIWLMPIHPTTTYHGYDVSDYYGINPDYGTMDDMKQLIEEAHARDMYIIMDYVANHTSNAHPFFFRSLGNPDSEYSDFYKFTNEDNTEYLSFAGVREMPEINYESEFAREYMIDVAKFWLDPNGDGDPSDGVDGFRCDVAIGPPQSFWNQLRDAMQTVNPEALLLGEVWLRSGLQLQEYLTGSNFNALFDFPTLHSIIADENEVVDGAAAGEESFEFVGLSLRGANRLYPEGAHLVRFINNHDTNRFMSEVGGDVERAKAGAVWLYTAPGTPMIYYGEEIGMFGVKGDNGFYDEYRREPMDWYERGRGEGMPTWFRPGDRFNLPSDGISVEEQENDPDSLLNLYRALGEYRNANPVYSTTYGTVDITSEGRDLYVGLRGDLAGEFELVIINFTNDTVTASIDDENITFSDLADLDAPFASGFSSNGLEFTLEPAGYVILSGE